MGFEVATTKGLGGGQDAVSGVNPVDRHVGHRLRERRSMLGLSQESLAAAIGVSFQQVQKYERGVNRISASRLWLAAQLLDVDIDYFFEGLPGNPAETPRSQRLHDPGISEVFAASGDTEELLRREILELARSVARIDDEGLRRSFAEMTRRLAERSTSRGEK